MFSEFFYSEINVLVPMLWPFPETAMVRPGQENTCPCHPLEAKEKAGALDSGPVKIAKMCEVEHLSLMMWVGGMRRQRGAPLQNLHACLGL